MGGLTTTDYISEEPFTQGGSNRLTRTSNGPIKKQADTTTCSRATGHHWSAMATPKDGNY